VSTIAVQLSPPRLTRWQILWRNLVAIAFGALLWAFVAEAQWDKSVYLVAVDLGLGAVTLVAMNFRRRWPLAMALVGAVTGVASTSSSGAALITFISLSTRRRWTEMLPVAAIAVAAGQLYYVFEPPQNNQGPWYVSLLFSVAFAGIAIAIGMYIGARRELLATLEDRAVRAEREQSMHVAQAQAQERNRIAREMHDVLAHRMSLVAMHAGALAFRHNLTEEETRDAAEIIQANSHRALTDLREILGVLREADDLDGTPRNRPQPTLCDLDELIADERASGTRVSLKNELSADDDIPESIGRTAYRVVQESLTNARKHAPSTQVDVIVAGRPGGGLSVEVRNPVRVGASAATTPGAGFGLIGLAERATLAHGRFEQGRTVDGDFVVRVWLPWAA
jgi:signal transduction histidine kinase